jgi:hypothetical protein
MSKKKKSQQEKLADAIMHMHPMYAAYLLQRIQSDTQVLVGQIPRIYEKDRVDMANGVIGFFSPDFYVTYANSLIEAFNDIDGTEVPLVEYEQKQTTN